MRLGGMSEAKVFETIPASNAIQFIVYESRVFQMISKNDIKEIRALGQKKFRDERGLFVVEGEKLVEEALRSGFDVVAHYRIEDIGEV